MSDAQLVEYYHARRTEPEEWEALEPISRPALLDVTTSVRFTAEEIAAVRERARGCRDEADGTHSSGGPWTSMPR